MYEVKFSQLLIKAVLVPILCVGYNGFVGSKAHCYHIKGHTMYYLKLNVPDIMAV